MDQKAPSSSAPEKGGAGGPKVIVEEVKKATATSAGANAASKAPKSEAASKMGSSGLKKLKSSKSKALRDEDVKLWEDFTPEEMKVLVREVEVRKEALFGDYKVGESPKYRWLIWQEVAEKVNEVNPEIHRNLEQVRIKWFDYKDPNNKWEKRVRKKPFYKHTTGMFFKSKVHSSEWLETSANDSEGDQSSAENKDGNGDSSGKKKGSRRGGYTGPQGRLLSKIKMSKVDEALRIKGIITTLAEDKATKAIKYLSHCSQRHGIAMMAKAQKESSGSENTNDGASKDSAAGGDDVASPAGNPLKKHCGRPKAGSWIERTLSDTKHTDGDGSKGVGKSGEKLPKIAPKTLYEMVNMLVNSDFGDAKEGEKDGEKKTGGVKRPAEEGTSPEPKRVMFGGTSAELAALLKTVDPSKVKKVTMKHPRTGKDVVVTKITAPEALAALGTQLLPIHPKTTSGGDAKAATNAVPKGDVPGAAAVQANSEPEGAKGAVEDSSATAGQSGSASKAVGSAKVLPGKDGAYPLLVPADALEKVTSSSNILIKHPVTGKGIIVSKVTKPPQAGTVTSITPIVTPIAMPAASKANVLDVSSENKNPVDGTNASVPASAPDVSTVQSSAVESAAETVGKGKDDHMDTETEPRPESSEEEPVQMDTAEDDEVDSGSNAMAEEVETSMETETESCTMVAEKSSDTPDSGEERDVVATVRTGQGSAESKEGEVKGEPLAQVKMKQVFEASGTVTVGEKSSGESNVVREVMREPLPKVSVTVKPDVGSAQGSATLSAPKGSPGTATSSSAQGNVKILPKETRVPEAKTPQMVSKELADKILRGIGFQNGTGAAASNAPPPKFEGGEVRVLNINGKLVKVILVKDEDYGKMGTKTGVPAAIQSKATTPVSAVSGTVPPLAPKVIPTVVPGVVTGVGNSVALSAVPSVLSPVVTTMAPVLVQSVLPGVVPNVVTNVVPGPVLNVVPTALSQVVTTAMPVLSAEPGMIDVIDENGKRVGKMLTKVGTAEGNRPTSGTVAPDGGTKKVVAVPTAGKIPASPMTQAKSVKVSTAASLASFVGSPLSLLTTVASESPNMRVPQRLAPKGSEVRLAPKKPNILSSGVKTVGTSPGKVSIMAGRPVSTFGVKRVMPSSVQAGTSKLTVRVVKDAERGKELAKKQHPLVKAALTGKPIDFQEELRKLDPEEGNARSEGAGRDGIDFGSNEQLTGISVKSIASLRDVPSTVSGVSTPGLPVLVQPNKPSQSIRMGAPDAKISLSNIAVLNRPLTAANLGSPAQVHTALASRSKRKREMVTNVTNSRVKVVPSMQTGILQEEVSIVDMDDCVIVEEVDPRDMNPPEVFYVDSNDSYGVEVH